MSRSLLSIVARALTIAHRVNRHCARPPARPPPFNTSCLRPSRPTLHLSPHTFSCTFHPPHTVILQQPSIHPHPRSRRATSLHPRHLCLFICSYTSFFLRASLSYPTNDGSITSCSARGTQIPSDAASSEASSSSPFGCGCSARAPLLLAPRFCQANKPLPTSGVVHARAPKWNGDLPSKKAKQKPTLPKHAQSLRTPQDPVPDSHPAFLHRLAQRRVPAPPAPLNFARRFFSRSASQYRRRRQPPLSRSVLHP